MRKVIYDAISKTESVTEVEQAVSRNVIVQLEIEKLKKQLSDTDYQAIKHSEGQISEEEYQSIKEQRQAWRDEINRLESEVL